MLNVCWQCGLYRADKAVDVAQSVAICPECGHRHPFRRLPLFVVSGASGAGKSTACQALLGRLTEVVLLDSDILWRPEFNTPETNYCEFFETWLRMCKNIGQSGRPVLLFGAGAGVPANLEACVERRYLAEIHILALTCAPQVLAGRLRKRPEWRGTQATSFIESQIEFNGWFQTTAQQPNAPLETLATTELSITEMAQQVADWMRARLPQTFHPVEGL